MAALRLESPQLSFCRRIAQNSGRFAQAPIRIYPSFSGGGDAIGYAELVAVTSPARYNPFVIDLVTVFASLLFHELAHAMVVERYGVAARRIDLYLFRGVVALDSLPKPMRMILHRHGRTACQSLVGWIAFALLILVGGSPSQPVVHGGLSAVAIFAPDVAVLALTFALYLNLRLFSVNLAAGVSAR